MAPTPAETAPLYTEQDFTAGTPDRIIEATDPQVMALWPHGDETLGALVGHHMYTERRDLLAYVDYLCVNPVAAAQKPGRRAPKL